jgi:hypothetical protein
MSVYRGNPDVIGKSSKRRDDPTRTCCLFTLDPL